MGGFLQHPSFDTGYENFEQYSWDDVRVVLFQKKKDFFCSVTTDQTNPFVLVL